jgi:hypothetical protein
MYKTKNTTVESTTLLSNGFPSNLTTLTLRGEIILTIFCLEYLVIIINLDCFKPPAVDPAQEPSNIKNINTDNDKAG